MPRPLIQRWTPSPRSATDWIWLVGFPMFLVVAIYVGFVVARGGADAILESRDGQVTDTRIDPSAPRYRLIVEPTTTGALAFESNGRLTMVSLLLPFADTGGGTWFVIPGDTVAPSGQALAATYAKDVDAFWTDVSELVGIVPTEVAVIDEAGIETLIGPTAPISVALADSLLDSTGAVAYAAGINQLQPSQAAEVLGWLNAGESIGNRFSRQEDVVIAWIDKLTDQPSPVVGEVAGTELGDLVTLLATAAVRVEPIPVLGTTGDGSGGNLFTPDTALMRSNVRQLAPFATAADSVVSPKTLVVNGASNDLAVTIDVARLLGANGARVIAIGNADNFLQEVTVIRYADPQWIAAANDLVDALGVGVAEADPAPNPAFDLTVEIGADAVAGR